VSSNYIVFVLSAAAGKQKNSSALIVSVLCCQM